MICEILSFLIGSVVTTITILALSYNTKCRNFMIEVLNEDR